MSSSFSTTAGVLVIVLMRYTLPSTHA